MRGEDDIPRITHLIGDLEIAIACLKLCLSIITKLESTGHLLNRNPLLHLVRKLRLRLLPTIRQMHVRKEGRGHRTTPFNHKHVPPTGQSSQIRSGTRQSPVTLPTPIRSISRAIEDGQPRLTSFPSSTERHLTIADKRRGKPDSLIPQGTSGSPSGP